ncbi:hypothetical protein CBR_g34581 [Chara braunii]|uniref:RING-type domain-containing protein n=1 Tax=Chara braunii TaxID=69332 RepID=A0A388LJ48_CHABU|nr:hypothetical protein CBR_g34581 [Chara braunii]|eukprot:GBG82297.1 hypothetical protein CBR_g34581 [Chara braunii]
MGVDLDLVVYADLLDPEMFCPICTDALSSEDALETPCGHVFCSGCLIPFVRTYTQCPRDRRPTRAADLKRVKDHNPFVYRLLGSLTVRCKKHKEGCTWQGEFSEASSHLANGCPESRQRSCAVGNGSVIINSTSTSSSSLSSSPSPSSSSSSSSSSAPSPTSVASPVSHLLDKTDSVISAGAARFIPPRLSSLDKILSRLDKVTSPSSTGGRGDRSIAENAVPNSPSPSPSPSPSHSPSPSNCNSGSCFECFRREIELRKAKAENKKKELHIEGLRSALSLLVSLVEDSCNDTAKVSTREREKMTSTNMDILKTVQHILLL